MPLLGKYHPLTIATFSPNLSPKTLANKDLCLQTPEPTAAVFSIGIKSWLNSETQCERPLL